MSPSVLFVYLVCSGIANLRGGWSVGASPLLIGPKTVDLGVKVENLKYEYCGPPDPTFLLMVKQVGTNPSRFFYRVRMTPRVDVLDIDVIGYLYLNGKLILTGPRVNHGTWICDIRRQRYCPMFANQTATAEGTTSVGKRFVLPRGHYFVNITAINQDGVEIACLRGSGDVLS